MSNRVIETFTAVFCVLSLMIGSPFNSAAQDVQVQAEAAPAAPVADPIVAAPTAAETVITVDLPEIPYGARSLHRMLEAAIAQPEAALKAFTAEQIAANDFLKLAQAWTAQQEAFAVPTEEMCEAARQNVIQKMASLMHLLCGDAAKEAGWKEALNWAQLEQAIQAKPVDLEGLKKASQRLSLGAAGLELDAFASVRRAISQCLTLAAVQANAEAAKTAHTQVCSMLAALLVEASKKSTSDIQRTVVACLHWMKATGQSSDLAAQTAALWGKPNLTMSVQNTVIENYASREIKETQPLRDFINNAQITGSSNFVGIAKVQMVPNADRAAFNIQMTGNAKGISRALSRSVSVWSHSNSQVYAEKTVSMDSTGFYADGARAKVSSNSQITNVQDSRGRHFIERLATRSAYKQQGSTQMTLENRQARKLEQQMDDQVNPRLRDLNHRIASELLVHLLSRGILPEQIKMSSDTTGMYGVGQLNNCDGVLTATDAPASLPDCQVQLAVQESLVENVSSAFLSNMRMDKTAREQLRKTAPKRIRDRLDKADQERAENAKQASTADKDKRDASADVDNWAFFLPEFAPVTVRFEDGKILLDTHLEKIQGTDKEYPAVDITLAYRVETRDGKVFFVQDAPADILPPTFDPERDRRLPANIVSLRRIMTRRLGEELPTEIEIEPITLKLNEVNDQPLILIPKTVILKDGWMQVGYNPAETKAVEAKEVAEAK